MKKSGLGPKSSVFFSELGNGCIQVSPAKTIDKKALKNFLISIEEYGDSISQVVYAAYYLGAEHIKIFSDNEIMPQTRSKIKETISYMSGTEIEFEDDKKIEVSVLLDKSKISVNNLVSRIGLVLQSSIKNCMEKIELSQIERNELEIDRLFHLASKIIFISLNDSEALKTSGIKHSSLSVPYLIICKKLENIADEIEALAKTLHKTKSRQREVTELLSNVHKFVKNNINFYHEPKTFDFSTDFVQEKVKTENNLLKIDNSEIRARLRAIFRYIYDVQEELVNLGFYNKMINEKIL